MSPGGMTVGDQWVQVIMNEPGPCGMGNIWVQGSTNSGACCLSDVISGYGAISYYLLSPRGV